MLVRETCEKNILHQICRGPAKIGRRARGATMYKTSISKSYYTMADSSKRSRPCQGWYRTLANGDHQEHYHWHYSEVSTAASSKVGWPPV